MGKFGRGEGKLSLRQVRFDSSEGVQGTWLM